MRPCTLIIDNFDSFTYNIVHAYQMLGERVCVLPASASLEEVKAHAAHLIVLGPGPGAPSEAHLCQEVLHALFVDQPFLGICLGHQIVAEVFGGRVDRLIPMHGKCSQLYHNNQGIFAGLPQGFWVARYHSLGVIAASLPSCLEVTAWTEQREVMGLRHRIRPIQSVQFHPESIASEQGMAILKASIPTLSTIRKKIISG